jgi:hypothetical protein
MYYLTKSTHPYFEVGRVPNVRGAGGVVKILRTWDSQAFFQAMPLPCCCAVLLCSKAVLCPYYALIVRIICVIDLIMRIIALDTLSVMRADYRQGASVSWANSLEIGQKQRCLNSITAFGHGFTLDARTTKPAFLIVKPM